MLDEALCLTKFYVQRGPGLTTRKDLSQEAASLSPSYFLMTDKTSCVLMWRDRSPCVCFKIL